MKPLKSSPTPDSARDAAPALPEGFVLRPWVGPAVTGVLCVVSLPLIAISLLIAAICTAAFALYSPIRRRRRSIDSGMRDAWAANEFGFERAIEAYEELIDAHVGAHALRRQ